MYNICVKRLVFTGGHHTGALEVAKKLQSDGWHIVWFGHRHTMWGEKADSGEYREVTAAGIKFIDLKAGKFYRTFHPLKLVRIPYGFFQALFQLIVLRPSGIVSFGGYLAVPTVIAGWLLGIPAITHEQTVVAGWANKLICLIARKIAITWPQSAGNYPKSKVIVIGLPLREDIKKIRNPKSEIRNLVYITGGKQGSHVINEAVFAALPQLLKKYTVIHQTGFADLSRALEVKDSHYHAFDFSSSQGISALAQAEVVVGRSGAHTTYELGFLGKKSVLIPIASASHNEQYLNAKLLADSNLAIILPQSHLTPQSLVAAIASAQKLSPHKLNLIDDATDKLVQLIKQQFS